MSSSTPNNDYNRLIESASMAPSAWPGDSVSTVGVPQQTTATTPSMKLTKAFRVLVIIQLILAAFIVLDGILCIAGDWGGECFIGIPLWLGLFAVVSGVFGVVASFRKSNKCVLVAYFVLCICTCVAVFFIIIMTSVYLVHAYRSRIQHVILLLIALTHLICSIITSALICSIWSKGGCCGPMEPTNLPPVVYIQASATAPDGQAQVVYVPVQVQQGQQMPMVLMTQQQPAATASEPQQPTAPPPPYKT